MSIYLNDILNLSQESLARTKIKFNVHDGDRHPLDIYKEDKSELLKWQFWNSTRKSYYNGQIAIGLVKITGHKWLLFDISRITEDLNRFNQVGYEYERINEFEKYLGRVIIEFSDNTRQVIRKAASVIEKCKVLKILEQEFDNDLFPGYENVNIAWADLNRVINKSIWETALANQKGVYLITDKSNGKMYVGSACGLNMLLGRWKQYVKSGHGGNKQLMEIDIEHIKKSFNYSILDIFKSTIDDAVILRRESWWKRTLMTRGFGYNNN